MSDESKPRKRSVKVEAEEASAATKPRATPATVQVTSELRFKRRMSQGDHGPAVAEIQRLLCAKDFFEGSTDGRYGTLLAKAVRRFQGEKGLKVNGEIDILTWKALSA